MANIWDKPNIPRKGWRCTNVIDLRPDDEPIDKDEYATCELCGNYPIRFVHVMEHDDYDGPMNVGCVCAEHISNDYVNPKARETRLKNKAARKRNWLSLKWKTSRKENPYLKKDGMILTVFPNKYKPGYWKYIIDGDFSRDSYPTEEAAKLALFEQYWENLDT